MKVITQPLLDKLSISASVICAMHCAAMPILLVLFPTLSFLPSDDHEFHQALIWLIVPLSLIAGFMGCHKHKKTHILICIITSLILLVITAIFAHEIVGEAGEKILTVFATAMLTIAHWKNYRQCRKKNCAH
ncbi:MAG: MerC domain-containing protein [Litorilituus sp.]|jgi:peptidoglycan/LPS O-acetylase OafA/YrhL|nr:MerC domain-containing protein [Litorilituus sp.]